MYDVGQRISTPAGVAIVLSVRWTHEYVRTDLGTFPFEMTSDYLDVDAITASPESLEAWLEADEPTVEFGERVRSESRLCDCACGAKGRCHHLVHVSESGAVMGRFPHSVISTDCRCLQQECKCVNS